jgi:hypothetical protein
VVFVMTREGYLRSGARSFNGAALNGHSDVRESVEEVMQIIENDGMTSIPLAICSSKN